MPEKATGAVRRNMPFPIPAVIPARLGVDQSLPGQALGRALLKDARLGTLQAADMIGVRAMLIHTLDQEAAAFYDRFVFARLPIGPLIMMMALKAMRDRLAG
jgi:GNAT superfamily N-acetyltransferase